ncbi:MAG: family intrarane metalloprotease [Chthonomonadales bacterium]|nr:family intrarane metalloprotease [Chthonomonadales bacterium]
MPDAAAVGIFLGITVGVALVWGRSLWYCDERSQAFRQSVLFAMRYTIRRPGEVRSLLLSAIYGGGGLLAALLLSKGYHLGASGLLSVSGSDIALLILGVIGEMSLATLILNISCRLTGQGTPEQFQEVRDIPWMKGLRELPLGTMLLMTALGAAVEETLFRGVVLRILTDLLHVSASWAILYAGGLFLLQQLALVKTAFQAMVISSACIAISLVGGMLVVRTGSLVVALCCHVTFAIFFMLPAAPKSRAA